MTELQVCMEFMHYLIFHILKLLEAELTLESFSVLLVNRLHVQLHGCLICIHFPTDLARDFVSAGSVHEPLVVVSDITSAVFLIAVLAGVLPRDWVLLFVQITGLDKDKHLKLSR